MCCVFGHQRKYCMMRTRDLIQKKHEVIACMAQMFSCRINIIRSIFICYSRFVLCTDHGTRLIFWIHSHGCMVSIHVCLFSASTGSQLLMPFHAFELLWGVLEGSCQWKEKELKKKHPKENKRKEENKKEWDPPWHCQLIGLPDCGGWKTKFNLLM